MGSGWIRSSITGTKAGGAVLLAHGHVVVSDVRVESAPELRAFLDETVREANRLAVDARAREQQREEAKAARAAEQEAKQNGPPRRPRLSATRS